MKKIYKIYALILALLVFVLQVQSKLVYASALPKVEVPEVQAEVIDLNTYRSQMYESAMTNNGVKSEHTTTGFASPLEVAGNIALIYDAANYVVNNGVYNSEYEARIQCIKDGNYLPDWLDWIDGNIYFATFEYADMTIGYYVDQAGEKIGDVYIQTKNDFQSNVEKACESIIDLGYKLFDSDYKYEGNEDICFGSENTYVTASSSLKCVVYTESGHDLIGFKNHVGSEYCVYVLSKTSDLVRDVYDMKTGNFFYNANITVNSLGNAFYTVDTLEECDYNLCGYPELSLEEVSELEFVKNENEYMRPTYIYMPAIVPATVPTGGKSYVYTGLEDYNQKNSNLEVPDNAPVEVPYEFPQEVPFPQIDPEVNPYVAPGEEIEPAPYVDPNPTPEIKPDPDPGTDPDPDPGTVPDPGTDPEPDPGTDSDIDIDDGNIEIPSAFQALDLKNKFPFCVPFDLIAGFKLLFAEPETPHWEWNLHIPGTDEVVEYKIDLVMFEKIAQLCRTLLTISFIMFLVRISRPILRG